MMEYDYDRPERREGEMETAVVNIRVTCPKCRTMYTDRYIPAIAMPEVTGLQQDYSDDCVMTSCPACDHLVSLIVRIGNGR